MTGRATLRLVQDGTRSHFFRRRLLEFVRRTIEMHPDFIFASDLVVPTVASTGDQPDSPRAD